jgi:cephalosporin-C deacetylase
MSLGSGQPPEIGLPEDFAEFWQDLVAEAATQPLDYRRTRVLDLEKPGFVVESLEFAGMYGRPLHGWIAYPEGARRLPSFLWVPPYGRESKLPDDYGTREGFCSMSFNFHGESAFHQEKYVTSRGYFAQGADAPENWIFRRMFQDSCIALRVLQAQLEVDEDRIGVMGMSQGGGMSVWLGAWNPLVRAVCADMPFLGNIWETLNRSVHRYPIKELVDFMKDLPIGEARVRNTVSYYDTATQAKFCYCPTLVSLGLKDPASRPENVKAIFEALPGPKTLKIYDWGHDWHPDMIENNRLWLLEILR